jgi:cyanophycin synthetase
MKSEKITAALKSFQNDAQNPGRTNLYRVGKGYVLVDYGHNPEAFAAICKMAARWRDKRVTAIVGVPGDRNDALIEEAGRVAAKGFQRIIIKEDDDTRGRKRGEVANLLCHAITNESPESHCSVVHDEISAFADALKNLAENEVVVIFYDKLEPVLEVLDKYGAVSAAAIEDSSRSATQAE